MSLLANIIDKRAFSGGAALTPTPGRGSAANVQHGLAFLLRAMQAGLSDTGQRWTKSAVDAAAATATPESIFFVARGKGTVTAIRFVPNALLTADNTNFATVTVRRRNADGSGAVTVASYVTNVAGGSLVAFTPKALTLSGTAANLAYTAGQMLTVEITKAAAGVAVPQGVLVVDASADGT